MFVTVEETRKHIEQVLGTEWNISEDRPKYIAIAMLPGAGRSVINYTLSYCHGMDQVQTSTERAEKTGNVTDSNYQFVESPFETSKEAFIIKETQYEVGDHKYGLDMKTLIETLKGGNQSLFSVSACGAEALRQLLGDQIFIAYVFVDPKDWLSRLQTKFHKPMDVAKVQERKAFGNKELVIFEGDTFRKKVIDQVFYYRTEQPGDIAERIYHAFEIKRFEAKSKAA